LPLSTLQKRCLNCAGDGTHRRARNFRALPRAGEAEGSRTLLEHSTGSDKEHRADGCAMNDAQLPKLFGWWWRDSAKALRGKFREKFHSFEHDYQLQLAAFDYELASRAEEGKPRYLLGKRFDKLSYEQMC